jgi:hypothetical protein
MQMWLNISTKTKEIGVLLTLLRHTSTKMIVLQTRFEPSSCSLQEIENNCVWWKEYFYAFFYREEHKKCVFIAA